jgi:hypothetical protein
VTGATAAPAHPTAAVAPPWRRAWDRWERIFTQTVSVRALALLRMAVAPLVWLHLQPFLDALDAGRTWRDRYHLPFWSWYPEVSDGVYEVLLRGCVVAAVLVSLGLCTRVATKVVAGVVAYNLFLSVHHFHNNRAFLLILLVALAITPCGKVLSVDSLLARRGAARRAGIVGLAPPDDRAVCWPLWLLRFELSCVYLGSGGSKLLDPDWFGGTVTWERVQRVHDRIVAESPAPMWAIDIVSSRDFHTVFAKVVVLTEITVALGLWGRRTRLCAVLLAIAFHLSIELTASVEVFSFAAVGALVVWSVPSTRDRVVVVRDPVGERVLLAALAWGDWLARFRVERRPDEPGPSLEVVDRDGTVWTGRAAELLVLSRLPLVFPFLGWSLPFTADGRRVLGIRRYTPSGPTTPWRAPS